METVFTPLQSLFGGILIGLAAVALMWTHGRIMGATGVLAGFVVPQSLQDWLWRAAVLAGMITAPVIIMALTNKLPEVSVPISLPMILTGGMLVGIGVTYGGGCTSGHGVCGNARFSMRSLVATVIFMLAAFATVFVIRHGFGG